MLRGNSSVVPLDWLVSLAPELLEEPVGVVHCKLDNYCANVYDDMQLVIDYLNSLKNGTFRCKFFRMRPSEQRFTYEVELTPQGEKLSVLGYMLKNCRFPKAIKKK